MEAYTCWLAVVTQTIMIFVPVMPRGLGWCSAELDVQEDRANLRPCRSFHRQKRVLWSDNSCFPFLKDFWKAAWNLKISQITVSKLNKMSQKISWYLKMSRNVSKCLELSQNSKKISQIVWNYLEIWKLWYFARDYETLRATVTFQRYFEPFRDKIPFWPKNWHQNFAYWLTPPEMRIAKSGAFFASSAW